MSQCCEPSRIGSLPSERTRRSCGFRACIRLLVAAALLAPLVSGQQPAGERVKPAFDPEKIEGVTIVLRPGGFATDTIDLPDGRFALGVLNRSGRDDIQLELDRMSGEGINSTPAQRLTAATLKPRETRWTGQFTLT